MSDWSDSYKTAEGDMFSPYERAYAMANKSKSEKQVLKERERRANFKARGLGITGKTTRPMTSAEKESILVLRTKGLTDAEIAEKTRRTTTTIAKVFKDAEAKTLENGLDWRENLKTKSIVAINRAYDEGEDVYKGGNLGLGVLKGLGELESEGSVNFNQLIGQIPESQRSRYITLEPADPNLITLEPSHALQTEERKDGGLLDAQEATGDETGH